MVERDENRKVMKQMNREILFRGKRVDNGEWVYGGYYHTNCYTVVNDYIMQENGKSEGVMPNTVGQYTGLTDKNGVKIFEGDVVLKRTYHGKEPFPVKFDGGVFCAGIGGGSSTATHRYTLEDKQIEVVGNIYNGR